MSERDANRTAAARLQAKFLREIPITRALGLKVEAFTGSRLTLSAALAPNVNDKGTAFAGSLNALMTLAGWGLVHLRLLAADEDCDIVIHTGEIVFTRPVRSPFTAVAELHESDWARLLDRLQSRGRGRILLATRIEAAGETAARLDASYVALRRDR